MTSNLLGPSWRTTLWGFFSNLGSYVIVLILAIAQNPPEYQNLWTPQTRQGKIMAIIGFVCFMTRTYRDWQTKDKMVSGGRIMQDVNGEVEAVLEKTK